MNQLIGQKEALKAQHGIRLAEDKLVVAIQTALDKKNYKDLKAAQFRNLVQVSQTTESTEVVINFLRYQVGRKENKGKWGNGNDSLAEDIISYIKGECLSIAKEIAKDVVLSDEDPAYIKLVGYLHIELVRRYLGYGARYLQYLKPDQDEGAR